MKRIWIILLVLSLALSLGMLSVSAAETDSNLPVQSNAQDNNATPENAGSAPSDTPSDMPDPAPDDSASAEGGARSFGEMVNHIWDTYAGEIFSALTLVTSLLLAYFYKRGLVPVVWNGLERINSASTAATDVARTLATSTDEKLSAFFAQAQPLLERIGQATETATSLADYVKTLEARLDKTDDERALVREVMAGVADMLYGVFTAANLPAYAKEQIGARYTAITTALTATEDPDDDTQAATL